MIIYHVLKYFGGTKTSKMSEKWKMNCDLDSLEESGLPQISEQDTS
jgi:hypothetical protein